MEATAPERGPFMHVRDGARALSLPDLVRGVRDSFVEHDLLVQAGAMAFRVFLALIPATLFVIGLLGVFGFDELWRSDVAPDVRDAVSPPAFKLIDDAVTKALTQHQGFWATAGALLALWEVSGVVRAANKVLNRVYRVDAEDRPLLERFGLSFGVGAGVGVCVLAALAAIRLGPLAVDAIGGDSPVVAVAGFVIRWLLALALLLIAVGLVVRTAPDLERPLPWVSFGALLVVGGWVVMSLAFGLYLTEIADYGSIFGNLATIFVLLEYLFLAAVVFLGGLVVDALVEEAS